MQDQRRHNAANQAAVGRVDGYGALHCQGKSHAAKSLRWPVGIAITHLYQLKIVERIEF